MTAPRSIDTVVPADEARMYRYWFAWRGESPQRHGDRLAQLRYSARRRQARITRVLSSVKVTLGCIDCGFGDPRALQWDHVNPATKVGNVGGLGNWAATWREMAKCVVRCANCHAIRSHDEGHCKPDLRRFA